MDSDEIKKMIFCLSNVSRNIKVNSSTYLRKTSVIGLIPTKVVLTITSVMPLMMFLITVMKSPIPTILLHQVTRRQFSLSHFSSLPASFSFAICFPLSHLWSLSTLSFSFAKICCPLSSAEAPSTAELPPSILLQKDFSLQKLFQIWTNYQMTSIHFHQSIALIDFAHDISRDNGLKVLQRKVTFCWLTSEMQKSRPGQVKSSQLMTMRLPTLHPHPPHVCCAMCACLFPALR